MKILVGYKRVVDYNVRIQVKPDGFGVVTDGVKLSPTRSTRSRSRKRCGCATKASRPRWWSSRSRPPTPSRTCATALAMGANRAIHVVSDAAIQPLTAARALLKLVEKEQPDLVLLGKQAIDDDCQPDRPDAGDAVGPPAGDVRVEARDRRRQGARVTREVDAGLETIEVDLPAVITTDLRLNEPRFIKLPDIMKAKTKPLETIALADLGVDTGDTLKTTHYAPPAKRSKGVMVKDAAELVAALKQKGLL